MSQAKKEKKAKERKEKKKLKRKKKNALVYGRDGKSFWTTQDQFWQWVRERVIVKVADGPLTGQFIRENEEYAVVLSNTVLNLRYPIHLSEALAARRRAIN